METNVTLRVRQVDVPIVEMLFDEIQEIYKVKSQKETVLKIDTENFLAADSCGGVDLFAARGKNNLYLLLIY